jgi:hypothetical protein
LLNGARRSHHRHGPPDAKGDVLVSELHTTYRVLRLLIASGQDEALLASALPARN